MYCKDFEDNSGAMELSRTPKIRPRTKHINLVNHRFREYNRRGEIIIYPISTVDQVVAIYTKPLAHNIFIKHRTTLLELSHTTFT